MSSDDGVNGVDMDDFDEFDDHSSNASGDSATDSNDTDHAATGETTPPPEENSEVVALTAEIDLLCSQATKEVDRLPRKTRNKLMLQTRAIFQAYQQHGSQQRLAKALEKYLLASDEGLDFTPRPPSAHPPKQVTRNIDPDSAYLVRSTPFHAADLTFEFSSNVAVPDHLLPSLDRIFGLYAAEGRALLKYLCEKYGDEPIFRVGVREYIQSQLRHILETTSDNAMALTPENRTFLRSVFERYPDINIAEKRMLARATRLDIETIETFWRDMTMQRRAYMGMRQFVAAEELRRLAREREEEQRDKQNGATPSGGGWQDPMFSNRA